jgi:hypothetical protein
VRGSPPGRRPSTWKGLPLRPLRQLLAADSVHQALVITTGTRSRWWAPTAPPSTGSTFRGDNGFRRAIFQFETRFDKATFKGNIRFDRARVLHFDDDPGRDRAWPDGWTVRSDPTDPSRGALVPAEDAKEPEPAVPSSDPTDKEPGTA